MSLLIDTADVGSQIGEIQAKLCRWWQNAPPAKQRSDSERVAASPCDTIWHQITYLLTCLLGRIWPPPPTLFNVVRASEPTAQPLRRHNDRCTRLYARLSACLPLPLSVRLSVCLSAYLCIYLSNLLAFCVWVSFGHIAYRIASHRKRCWILKRARLVDNNNNNNKSSNSEDYAHKWIHRSRTCLKAGVCLRLFVCLFVCMCMYVCLCYVEHIPSLWHDGWLTVNIITVKASSIAATYWICAPLCAFSRLL